MSRTKAGVLNQSFSSADLSEQSEWSEKDEDEIDDAKVNRILSREIFNHEILDVLPPTPKKTPPTRSTAKCPVSPAFSMSSVSSSQIGRMTRVPTPISPMSVKSFGRRGVMGRQKKKSSTLKKDRRSIKDMCKELEIDMDENELEEIEKDDLLDKDRPRVDFVIEDILGLGLGKRKGPGGVKEVTIEEEKRSDNFQKLRSKQPLEINGDGRCGVLKEDLGTIKRTLDGVNALISALEKVTEKLVNDDQNLYFTPPPV